MDFIDGADGGQIRILQLLEQPASACVHQVDRMQSQATKILTDVSEADAKMCSAHSKSLWHIAHGATII